jgi:hypothetical protein
VACSPNSGGNPASSSVGHALRSGTALTTTAPVTTGDLVDVGIPPLANVGDSPVRVLRITLTVDSPAPSFRPFQAFSYRRTHAGVIDAVGDLPRTCPNVYVPLTARQRMIAAHKNANWFAVVPVRVTTPGKFAVGPFHVTYQTADGSGQTFVQSFNLRETLNVRNGHAENYGTSECQRPGPPNQ